jgi:hypothetical protein
MLHNMTACVQLKKNITGRESQGACRVDELISRKVTPAQSLKGHKTSKDRFISE